MEKLFRNLRSELKQNYEITKNSINFIPFEKWRGKLKTYPIEFKDEYSKNILYLKKKFKLDNLKKINNKNKKLILFLGIPGVGKTTLAEIIEKNIPNTILIRGHDIVDYLKLYGKDVEKYRARLRERKFNYPDPWYISYLYQEQLTKNCLDLGYNVVFDDHIRTKNNRLGYYNLSKQKKAKIIFIQVNAPLEICMKREEDEPNKNKLKFLANFIFQSQDFNKEEKKKYDKILEVDATTSNLNEINKYLISELKNNFLNNKKV